MNILPSQIEKLCSKTNLQSCWWPRKQIKLPLPSTSYGTTKVVIPANNLMLFLSAGYNPFLPCGGQDGARPRWYGKGESFSQPKV